MPVNFKDILIKGIIFKSGLTLNEIKQSIHFNEILQADEDLSDMWFGDGYPDTISRKMYQYIYVINHIISEEKEEKICKVYVRNN